MTSLEIAQLCWYYLFFYETLTKYKKNITDTEEYGIKLVINAYDNVAFFRIILNFRLFNLFC